MTAEPFWIEEADVLAVHDRLLVFHGGAVGVRDRQWLQSAMARPRQFASYEDAVDIVQLAAAYTVGIVRNHPFADGNKRTGFVVGVLFLELNGHRFTAEEEAATQAVLALATGLLDEAGYAAFLRDNVTRSVRPEL